MAVSNTLSVWQALLFAFIGGLILNLMPCVLPILSMKALGSVSSVAHSEPELKSSILLYS